jgi:hypothetical protein
MNAQELITELSRQGIILEACDDGLRIEAPKGLLTAELRQTLVEQKQAILTLLQTPPALILRKAQDAAEPVITRQEDTITVSMETLKHGGDLSKRLYEYLQNCPEYWKEYLIDGLNKGKFLLSRTTEAARRVAQKDIDGAKRILNTSTPAFRESFTTFRTGFNEQWKVETISEPIEVDSIVGMFGDKPTSAETTRAAPTVPEPLNLDAPPRRLYMDAGREEIIAEILRLERKHIKDGLHYDRVWYLGDNTLNRRKEFLLDYLYSLCDHLESYQIGIHDLAERQAIQELKKIEDKKTEDLKELVFFKDTSSKIPSLTLFRETERIAKLAEYGVYRPNLTKGEASDLLAQIFAREDT